jgi:hypothetical protein
VTKAKAEDNEIWRLIVGKRKEVPLKEKYRLWWEYLQRSEELPQWVYWKANLIERMKELRLRKGLANLRMTGDSEKLLNKEYKKWLNDLPKKYKIKQGEGMRRNIFCAKDVHPFIISCQTHLMNGGVSMKEQEKTIGRLKNLWDPL